MLKAIIDSWSLNNPTVLNNFKQLIVTVEYEPHSNVAKYHHIFLIEVENTLFIDTIQKEMQEGWYSFFWNETKLYIVFNTQRFEINLPNGWFSEQYKEAQQFAKSQNIQDEYLDFKKDFDNITGKYNTSA